MAKFRRRSIGKKIFPREYCIFVRRVKLWDYMSFTLGEVGSTRLVCWQQFQRKKIINYISEKPSMEKLFSFIPLPLTRKICCTWLLHIHISPFKRYSAYWAILIFNRHNLHITHYFHALFQRKDQNKTKHFLLK